MEDNAYLYLKPQSVRQQFDPKFQPNPRNKSMSCSSFLLKILVIALFLCVIPLFPSEPPEFISQTVFAKSWELIHLLVIGIALSYGLFCRRKNPEQVSPKSVNFQQYKQNAVHHSSIFDCVDENPSVKLGKNVVEDKSCDFSGFRTEPYVVVRQGSGGNVEERSLGLPVRSLRSRVVESDSEDECVSEGESDCSGESSCSESSSCTVSEKGEILEGNVERNGFGNEWNSRSVREGFIAGSGDFEVHDGKGESFEGNLGSYGFSNGVKSRSMRASSMAGNSGFEMYGEKGEAFEGNMGSNGFSNGMKSRSMRASSMAGNSDFQMYDEKGENFEGNMGSNSIPYGLKSQSMRAGFTVGNGDLGENFEGNVGSNVFPNEWNSRSFMAGFMPGCGQNLEGNVEASVPPNGCESPFMAGKGENFVGNVGSNAFPYGWNSRSMETGYTAESGKVELASAKGENLEENLGKSPQVSWKSRSMRSNYMVNNGPLEPELLKSRSFRSPVQGGAPCGMNAGVCSWLPESPNMVEGQSWNGVNNMPFPSFRSQADNSNLVGSAPTSEKCNATSSFYIPSTATPCSVPVSTSDFASGSRMHDYEDDSWSTPILENVNTFVGNSAAFTPAEKDISQPIFSSSPKKNEEYFMPRTPEIPPSILRAPGELASSVREPRRPKSKLKLSGKKHEKQLEKDIGVEPLVPRDTSDASRIIPPVSIPTPLENVSLPINVTFPKKNEDFFPLVGKNTSLDSDTLLREAPNNEIASSAKAPTWAKLSRRTLLKKDSGVRSESNYETPKDDVILSSKGSSMNENEKKATPVKWDENCFVIPLSEINDAEDLVQQPAYFSEVASSRSRLSSDEQEFEQNGVDEDVILKEPAYVSEVASSRSRMSTDEQESEQNGMEEDVLLKEPVYLSGVASSRSRLSCDEQESERNEVEEDVPLKETIDYSEIEVLSKEIEPYKPSTPSSPGTPPVESSSKALCDSFVLVESPKNVKSLSKAPHSRGFSCTSFFDRELRKSIKNEAREENRMSEGDQYVGKAGKCGCLSLDVRPSLSKAALKGKSVRTIRPQEVVPETINHNVQSDQKKEENSGMVVIKIGISEKRSSSNGRKREKQGGGGTSIIVGLSSKEGSNSKASVLCDVQEEPDSEIDKKADEFIAKFKEQIRIEKVTTRGNSSRRQVPQKKSLYQT